MIEDVLVRVDKCYFPVDFFILDMEPSQELNQNPIILGRPFLATANANINCKTGAMDISFGNQKVRINVFNTPKYTQEEEDCFVINQIDEIVESNSSLDLLQDDEPTEDTQTQEVNTLLNLPQPSHSLPWSVKIEPLPERKIEPIRPSIQAPPQLELKPLPESLKYVFLGSKKTLPVIIASNLTTEQENQLVNILKTYKEAIGWTVADLKGISPSICMHHIYTEDNAKPTREMQRRLNPNMQEVVKKEVIKWLDAGIIYPISDSHWVSPTQVVPKKSGLTVVRTEHGNLVPTRLSTGWRVCIDYRKLNTTIRKDHFPLPFIDQILERLAGQQYFCF